MSRASAPQFAIRGGCRAIGVGLSGATIITQKSTRPRNDLAGRGFSQASRRCHWLLPARVRDLAPDVFDPARGAPVAKASDQASKLDLHLHGLPGCASG